MRAGFMWGGGAYAHIGRLRLRFVSRDFRPLFSERHGYRPWRTLGRFGWRIESRGNA